MGCSTSNDTSTTLPVKFADSKGSKMVLTYFNLMARAEGTRMMLTWAKTPFVDQRLSF